jgi:hypothetical protein
MVENDGVVFLSVDVDDLFALGDGGERLVDDFERFERLGGGVELSQAAVDQHQAGHGLFFFLLPLVAARDHLAHGGEIVHAGDGLDDELAVVGFLHLAVFPHHHRCHRFRSLNVRDVEALDALWQLGQAERLLQGFLNGARIGLQNAETLIVRLLGIGAGEIDEFAFVSALRNGDMHSCGAGALARELLAERVFKFLAIFEVDGNVDVARDVGLREIELL